MHLAVEAGERTVLVQDGGGVVIEAGGAALEEGSDDHDFLFAGNGSQTLSAGAGDGLGEIEEGDVFALAEILCAEKLGQADDLRAFARGFADAVGGLVEVRVRIRPAAHLHEAHSVIQIRRHIHSHNLCSESFKTHKRREALQSAPIF